MIWVKDQHAQHWPWTLSHWQQHWACQILGGNFYEKKRLRQDFPAARGLVRSWPKASPAPKKYQIWFELSPESRVWAENLSKWIVWAVQTHPDHSEDSGRRPRPNFPSPARRSRAINVSLSFALCVSQCIVATDVGMLLKLCREAARRRTAQDTDRNAASSRSHAFYRASIAYICCYVPVSILYPSC